MRENGEQIKIDVGIITIKPEEFSAVTSRFDHSGNLVIPNLKHDYIQHSIRDINGFQYNVAIARCLEPGTGNAQSLASDMIEELNPKWLFLVGIAGGVPAAEYSLGDVLLCTRLHDFSVCCIDESGDYTFAVSSSPIHPEAAKLLEILPAYRDKLEAQGWNSYEGLSKERPNIDLNSCSLIEDLYGDENWQDKVINSLKCNFLKSRKPIYYLGPTGSSDCLIKNDSLIKSWLSSARGLTAVEMELAGVYRAVENRIPILAIRSLSDIIGYKRTPEWTQFACESAASFAICLIEAGILKINGDLSYLPRESISIIPSVGDKITQKDKYISLPFESPFHHVGTIPLNHQSYIRRDSDEKLEKIVSNSSFICIHGDYTYGKSSLLIRVPEMLSGEWFVFRPKIDLYETSRKGSFVKNFFAEIQGKNQEIRNWVSMHSFLNKTKGVFLIDEIGKCDSQEACELIQKLYALVDYASYSNVRVILTLQKPLDIYLKNIGLENPKYYLHWENIELTEFNDHELIELLDKFPQQINRVLQEDLDAIKRYTSMKPNETQKFCNDLWRHLRKEAIPLEEIDQKVKCYLENLKKA